MTRDFSALERAIPYIKAFKGKVFVIKIGGDVCSDPSLLADQISILQALGLKLIVVHGGGVQATNLGEKLAIESHFVKGRRVTSPAMLEVIKMAVKGIVNTDLVSALLKAGVQAVGISGVDAGVIVSKKRPPKDVDGENVDFGLVGDIKEVRPELLNILLESDYVPVVACLSTSESGTTLNVNGDTVAVEIAVATKAEKIIFLTSTDGVMKDINDSTTLISQLTPGQTKELISDGTVSGGMVPKLENCLDALSRGIPKAHIINGKVKNALLTELFTNEGCGTMISE
jgi:acetylglutamate kinase